MSVVYDAPGEKVDAIVEVPRDVEADVVSYFRRHELQAQTELEAQTDDGPRVRVPGMVRVTRTGGELTNLVQDAAQVLVETWETNSVASWALAQRAWALLALAANRQQLNDVELYDVDLGVPYTLDDDLAPELHRHQFLAVLTVPLTDLTLSVEGASS